MWRVVAPRRSTLVLFALACSEGALAAPSRGAACVPPPAPTGVTAAGADGELVVSWAASASSAAFAVHVSISPTSTSTPPPSPFGYCGSARTRSRRLAGDVRRVVFPVPNGAAFSVVVSAAAACGASAAAPAVLSAPVAPPTLPVAPGGAPAFWLDARALAPPAPGSRAPASAIADSSEGAGWALRPAHGDFGATRIALRGPRPGRASPALVFGGPGAPARDFLVLNVTLPGDVPAAGDTAAFGWTTDADNSLTLVAVFRSSGGGWVASKGGYAYQADAGWLLVDSPSYLGLSALMTSGDRCDKCDVGAARADLAINQTDVEESAPAAGAVLSIELAPVAGDLHTGALRACLGPVTGGPFDECSDTPGQRDWAAHLVDDRDLAPVGEASSVARWAPGAPLMHEARAHPFAVGGGFFWGGTRGASRLPLAVFTGELHSLALFRRRLAGDERERVAAYLGARYGAMCAPRAAPPGVRGPGCPAARAGRNCTLACLLGSQASGGSHALVCADGAWAGGGPVCGPPPCGGPPARPPAGADTVTAPCTVALVAEAWPARGAGGDGALTPASALLGARWETAPPLAPALADSAWIIDGAAGGLVGSVPFVDTEDAAACDAPAPSALVLNRPAWPALAADPDAAGAAAVVVTVAAAVVLDADAAGGLVAGVVAPEPVAAPLDPWAATSLLRVTLVGGGAGGAWEVVRGGVVVASERLLGWANAAGAPTLLALALAPAGARGSGDLRVAVSVNGAVVANVSVAAWPSAAVAGAARAGAGVHVASGRARFLNFTVSATNACGAGGAAGACDPARLLPGQACAYACAGGGLGALTLACPAAGRGAALVAGGACAAPPGGGGGAAAGAPAGPLSPGATAGVALFAVLAAAAAGSCWRRALGAGETAEEAALAAAAAAARAARWAAARAALDEARGTAPLVDKRAAEAALGGGSGFGVVKGYGSLT